MYIATSCVPARKNNETTAPYRTRCSCHYYSFSFFFYFCVGSRKRVMLSPWLDLIMENFLVFLPGTVCVCVWILLTEFFHLYIYETRIVCGSYNFYLVRGEARGYIYKKAALILIKRSITNPAAKVYISLFSRAQLIFAFTPSSITL